jgi:3-hydroxybutyryl-CoA dehydrogenase
MAEIFGVIGAGTMGNGIAQVAARAGFDVVMRDVSDEFLARGMTRNRYQSAA